MTTLGTPYIWAGGSATGPTTGGCTDPVAPCGVVGYDCSGLTLFAWAPFLSMDHFANTQYSQAGRYDRGPGDFRPGDLLFWGNPAADGGLHHVAMYVGGGNVIQAPESGDVVRITPWDQVSFDYYGATRPLT
jgi:peptidoglycan DL-endopeptidase RipA